jgi:hypothetical protein
LKKKAILSLLTPWRAVAGWHLDKGPIVWNWATPDLKTRINYGSGILGTPCHGIWVEDNLKRRSWREGGSDVNLLGI